MEPMITQEEMEKLTTRSDEVVKLTTNSTTITDEFDKMEQMAQEAGAVVVKDEVGEVEQAKNPETLKKAAYYVVFAVKDHEANSVDDAIKNVHIARFESKNQVKGVIKSLDENNFKLIDIIKGRPLAFSTTVRKVVDVTIGQ